MKTFLRLRHWQLFSLFVVPPLVLQFITIWHDDSYTWGNFTVTLLLMIVFGALLLGWLYALGKNLHTKLPPTITMSLKLFKIFFFVPAIYILLGAIIMIAGEPYFIVHGKSSLVILSIIFLLHLFSMFGILYCFYFIAKALKSTELQKPVRFSDFTGEFFLIWFFPVGIWVIQPRINKLFGKSKSYPSNE
ncbi:hypothetical protein [Microbacter margulisiae]|uniref:Uncharacterized protein n=1 Tax=Microbacter margulisiae TaxID=1350067 RepID=A0A7W5H375_9PORP|nr:hypothetical protein [Microbacter margulisiae]MBB3188525.1 hypothetical protein [Microbacter margulisiae]